MLQAILLLQLGLVALAVVLLRNQKSIIKEMTKPKPKRKPQRRQRPRRHVIVKKTHEREIVRVVPTSTEFMQQQYKRVAEQYANK
jgi:hypothetical protein